MLDTFLTKVEGRINYACDELKLTPFVRTKCIEMSKKKATEQDEKILDANGVACAIVSIVHEDARRNGRVSKHLPNKMIGKALGMDSGTVVHNIHLFNSGKH
ncbi:MAG: hypothetical protein ABI347_03260 [Nitrososphaera sp.]|jgi:hypothetical protein